MKYKWKNGDLAAMRSSQKCEFSSWSKTNILCIHHRVCITVYSQDRRGYGTLYLNIGPLNGDKEGFFFLNHIK